MNLIRWISDCRARSRAKPELRFKISNVTRQTVLASYADLADRGPTRRKGLLGRDHLPEGEGMWIIPCEAVHTFRMKFSIDLVYLSRDRKVKKVRSDVPPGRMSACLTAHSIVELPAGTIRKTLTQAGDKLEFSQANPVG